MALSELQKGFGPALLKQSSPEGKLIAELQQVVGTGLQVAEATLLGGQIKSLSGHGVFQLLPAPGAAAWYEIMQISACFVPGADAGGDPLVQSSSGGLACSYGDPNGGGATKFANFTTTLLGATVARFEPMGETDMAFDLQNRALSTFLGLPLLLSSTVTDGSEVISGNTLGDARLRLRVCYWLRNLDF